MANIEQLHDPLGPIAFLKTIDFFEETLDEIAKLEIKYLLRTIFLIYSKRQPNRRLFNNFDQSRLSINEMKVIFTWKTIKKFAFPTYTYFI